MKRKSIPTNKRGLATILNKLEGKYAGVSLKEWEFALGLMDAVEATLRLENYKSMYAARARKAAKAAKKIKSSKRSS